MHVREIIKTDVDTVVLDFSDLIRGECKTIYFSDTATAITICKEGDGVFRVEKRQVLNR